MASPNLHQIKFGKHLQRYSYAIEWRMNTVPFICQAKRLKRGTARFSDICCQLQQSKDPSLTIAVPKMEIQRLGFRSWVLLKHKNNKVRIKFLLWQSPLLENRPEERFQLVVEEVCTLPTRIPTNAHPSFQAFGSNKNMLCFWAGSRWYRLCITVEIHLVAFLPVLFQSLAQAQRFSR